MDDCKNQETKSVCALKEKCLILKEKLEHAMQELILLEASNSVCLNLSSRRTDLNHARILTNYILHMHDRETFCVCFPKEESRSRFIRPSIYQQTGKAAIFEYMKKLTRLLDYKVSKFILDESCAILEKSELNPCSKSFVPVAIGSELSQLKGHKTDSSKYAFGIDLFSNEVIQTNALNSDFKIHLRSIWDETPVNADLPVIPCLTTCFYGMHRHTVATQPTIRLSRRPERFTSIWSVTPEDKKLFNPAAVASPCGCPPAFGYSIPNELFGNIFNRKSTCKERRIHLSCYPNGDIDDELDILPACHEQNFNDVIENNEYDFNESDEKFLKMRLNVYKNTFAEYVSEICRYTEKVESVADSKSCQEISSDEGISLSEEDANSKLSTYESQLDESEGTSDSSDGLLDEYENLVNKNNVCCRSPCSVWCNSRKATNSATASNEPTTLVCIGESECGTLNEITIEDKPKDQFGNLPNSYVFDSFDTEFTYPRYLLSNQPSCLLCKSAEQRKTSANSSYCTRTKGNDNILPKDSHVKSSEGEIKGLYAPPCPNFSNQCFTSQDFESEHWTPLPDCSQIPGVIGGYMTSKWKYSNWTLPDGSRSRRTRQKKNVSYSARNINNRVHATSGPLH